MRRRVIQIAIALVPPWATLIIQLSLWEVLRPYAWLLFYPAIMASSWLGGLRTGVAATILSTAIVWWFFVPPEHAFVKVNAHLVPTLIFLTLGCFVSASLARLKAVNDELRRAVDERRIFASLVETSPDFIELVAPAHGLHYLNPAARRLVGLESGVDVGEHSVLDFRPPGGHGETTYRNEATGETVTVSQRHFAIRDPATDQALGVANIARDMSATKQMEQSLRDLSADLARAQTVAGVGSWRFDETRNARDWSDEVYRILGIPLGTPPTRELYTGAIHPDDRPTWDRAWAAALKGQPYDIEHRIIVDGIVRWAHAKAELQFDERGELLGGIGTIQDVTDRRRLEDDLRTSVALATGILSISADSIISIDDEQRITLFNEGAVRTFGYAKHEVLGAPLEMLIPVRFRERHRKHIQAFAAGATVSRGISERHTAIFGLRRNGEEFAADASISKIEVRGNLTMTVSLRDVSEQRRIETEQRVLAELGELLGASLDYEQRLDNLGHLVVRELADYCLIDLIAPGGEILRCKASGRDASKQWICDVLARVPVPPGARHLARETLTTKRAVLVHAVSPAILESFARDAEQARALHALEARSIIVAPLLAGNAFLGAMSLVASRTSHGYGARELRFAEELARRATLSFENARLYQAAREAIQSRDEVLGVVAHDLRNPLNAIMLCNDSLARETAESIKKPVGAIDRAARRMRRLIGDLLDVTSIEAGSLRLDVRPVDAARLVREVVDAQSQLASAASIALRVDAADALPPVRADRDRLVQILDNLIGNAIKFTDDGDVVVAAKPGDREVVFSIADTGAGISADDQPHVFDRFWQGRRVYARRGAGLGLSIVKGLVEAHDGRIWLTSSIGRGTTVYFTIPTVG